MTRTISRQESNVEKQRYWNQHLNRWRSDGSSQIEYCRKNNISRFQFQYWKRRLQPSEKSPSFIEVRFSSVTTQRPSHALRLIVDDHYQIAVERDFDPVALKQLIGTLERV
jgi:hypothetical protein